MTSDELSAWLLLCETLKENGLHQYDFWDDVPTHVKQHYLKLVKLAEGLFERTGS